MVNNSLSPVGREWWNRPGVVILLVLSAAVPLFWPDIPPLTDLPGHMGRYRVQIDGDTSASLRQFFTFRWALVGNLGVDLLVVPMSRLFGLELGVKLIVLAIPPLTVAGFLWTAHEAHGRVPPTALFALPFAYGFPFIFGFVNFALSAALAFLALGLWIRMGRLEMSRARAALFVPISCVLWTAHVFGWGVFGVLGFASELARRRERGQATLQSAASAAFACLPLTPPLLLMILARSGGAAGFTGDWFNMPVKWLYLLKSLTDAWMLLDLGSVGIVVAGIVVAAWSKAFTVSRELATGALLLGLVYLLLPRILLGSAFADMRLAPFMLAVAVLAFRPAANAPAKVAHIVAAAGLAFVTVRTVAGTLSFATYDRSYSAQLQALRHIPKGARVAAFAGKSCDLTWATPRLDHLPGLAIVRRHAFANDQWTLAGAQLLHVRYAAPGFTGDPSQLVVPNGCRHPEWRMVDAALRRVPRAAFDYIWLIDPPAYDPRLTRGLTPVWRRGTSVLFRISPRAEARTPASRSTREARGRA